MRPLAAAINSEEYLHKISPILFPSGFRQRLIMVLQVYSDLGVNRDTIAMCGYLCNVEKWESFNREWESEMVRTGLKDGPGYFHMTDFNAKDGVYKPWSQEKRDQCFNQLLNIIDDLAAESVIALGSAVGVVRSHYESLTEDEKWRLGGSQFGFCSSVLIGQTARALMEHGIFEPVRYSFELGDECSGLVVNEINGMVSRGGEMGQYVLAAELEDKRRFPGLQAADILAFEVCRYLPIHFGVDDRYPRHVITRLVGQSPIRCVKRWFDAPLLRKFLNGMQTREIQDGAAELFGD